MEQLFTIDEIARFLRLKPEIVRRKVRSGNIRAYKIGKSWRISDGEIKNFMSKCLS
jgi:excisionase family DNA binding protein